MKLIGSSLTNQIAVFFYAPDKKNYKPSDAEVELEICVVYDDDSGGKIETKIIMLKDVTVILLYKSVLLIVDYVNISLTF